MNTLLTEMDGMQNRNQVYVIAATNRPDMIDPAMLRPGRLDKALYVDLPNENERLEILKTLCRKTPLDKDVDLKVVANDTRCNGFSGADLASLVRESAVSALRERLYTGKVITENLNIEIKVQMKHFMNGFQKVPCSVSKRVFFINLKDRKKYELLKVKFGSGTDDIKSEE